MALKTKYMKDIFLMVTLPPVIFVASRSFDNYLKQFETAFRDKSARYGKDLKPGELPSW